MITNLHTEGFRNIKKTSLEFSEGINIFQGLNGAGKTNILEAIGLFALGKSCRGSKDTEMVNFDRELAEVVGNVTIEKKKLK